ncbi:MAG: hypothetical protein U9Q15_00025, partial [Patescibacteria group bacterium]|nr:hypothetical protein [Patescibacteria group bacterium]
TPPEVPDADPTEPADVVTPDQGIVDGDTDGDTGLPVGDQDNIPSVPEVTPTEPSSSNGYDQPTDTSVIVPDSTNDGSTGIVSGEANTQASASDYTDTTISDSVPTDGSSFSGGTDVVVDTSADVVQTVGLDTPAIPAANPVVTVGLDTPMVPATEPIVAPESVLPVGGF